MRHAPLLLACCWLAACGGRLSPDPGNDEPDGGQGSASGGTSDGGSMAGASILDTGGRLSTGGRPSTGGRLGTGGADNPASCPRFVPTEETACDFEGVCSYVTAVKPCCEETAEAECVDDVWNVHWTDCDCPEICPVGMTPCGSGCVDLLSDPDNCGMCGNSCPTTHCGSCGICVEDNEGYCAGGVCVDTCAAGLSGCGTSCVDICTDVANCGECGRVCPPGTRCLAGSCECTGPTEDVCGLDCVDLASDPRNCGGCNVACGAGMVCINGVCTCPAGWTACNGGCVDTQSSPSNCGGCGIACPSDTECVDGTCQALSWFACEAAEDCLVTYASCCGACGAYSLDDVIALNRDEAQRYREEQYGEGSGCPACAAASVPSIATDCIAGRCEVVFLLDPRLTGCSEDDDCIIRARQCCECGAPAEYVALSSDASAAYQSLVCEAQQPCDECLPSHDDVFPECSDGQCRVRLF